MVFTGFGVCVCVCVCVCVNLIVCLFPEPKPEHNYSSDWLKKPACEKNAKTQADVLDTNYPSCSSWKHTRAPQSVRAQRLKRRSA